jgi:hypothetical protein
MSDLEEYYCPKCKTISIFEEYDDPNKPGYFGGEICRTCKWDNKAGDNHVFMYNYHPHKETCSNCKKEHMLLTQDDDCPEYNTSVGLICECGEEVWFSLLVN